MRWRSLRPSLSVGIWLSELTGRWGCTTVYRTGRCCRTVVHCTGRCCRTLLPATGRLASLLWTRISHCRASRPRSSLLPRPGQVRGVRRGFAYPSGKDAISMGRFTARGGFLPLYFDHYTTSHVVPGTTCLHRSCSVSTPFMTTMGQRPTPAPRSNEPGDTPTDTNSTRPRNLQIDQNAETRHVVRLSSPLFLASPSLWPPVGVSHKNGKPQRGACGQF